jgi:hypothetical protein
MMKCTLQRAHIRYNNSLFGMADSGAMSLKLVLRFIQDLPPGITELHFHPATGRSPEIDEIMSGYRHEEEFRVLTSGQLLQALQDAGIQRLSFSDLC